MNQLNHYNTTFKKQSFPIVLICDNVSNAPNIGSLFRIADAFGIETLIFCGHNIPIGKRMTKTSRSTEKYVTYRIEEDIDEVVSSFKTLNYKLIALEITESSQPLSQFKIKNKQPIALIIGDENFGVSNEILKQVDETIHIDMFGHNSSMNVVQATSIALYEFTRQLNN